MKGMPLPFDFEGKGVLGSAAVTDYNSYFSGKNCLLRSDSFGEPTSVLDSRIPSGPTSSSTLSSSLGGSGGGCGGGVGSSDTAGLTAVSDGNPSPKWQQQDSTTATSFSGGGADSGLVPVPPSLGIGGGGGGPGGDAEKYVMEDWENVLSESASPNQEQSIFRWIMRDVEDHNKLLQMGGGGGGCGGSVASEFDFGGGFGGMDQGFVGDHNFISAVPNFSNKGSTADKIDFASNEAIAHLHNQFADSSTEMKPSVLNPQLMMNQHPSFFSPFPYEQQQEQTAFVPPPAKRLNSGGAAQIPKGAFLDTKQQQEMLLHHLQSQTQTPPPHYLHQRLARPEPGPKIGIGDELQQQQAITEQLYKAAELLQTGNNPVLAQGILARLNHYVSPIGKPFDRAAFYCKEALQLLLNHHTNTTSNTTTHHSASNSSPFSLIFKIGAYKSFSEISPLIEFANFTCNQALLEVMEGFDRIHIVDFDIGYGGQWASLMQELALRSGGPPLLKITALASPLTHDQLELSLTRENLIHFANEINIGFDFEVISIDCLNSGSWSMPLNEAIAVNLPVGCITNYQLPMPLVLRFVKQLSPRIVVSVDRGCDRNDLPFANHIIHALHSYSNLLESLDAVNLNMDALQKIEKFLLQPGIEKIVMGRFQTPEKSQHWRSLFLSSGFSPVMFSNFTESQAECVVKRTPVRGFQVEKRQSSLVLCWQRKELISASVWRCC